MLMLSISILFIAIAVRMIEPGGAKGSNREEASPLGLRALTKVDQS
jgi:hypothetical protein